MAKKAKKTVRREYTKADVKELRAHSKAKTPVAKIMKLTIACVLGGVLFMKGLGAYYDFSWAAALADQ